MAPYVITAIVHGAPRRETGANIWSAAGWADYFRGHGADPTIEQGGRPVSYAELMSRERVALAEKRKYWRRKG